MSTATKAAARNPVLEKARWIGIAGVLFLVLALAPRYEHETEANVGMKTFSLGLPFSPLFARTERVTHGTQDGIAQVEMSETGMEFGFPSWSLLSLALGVGLRAYARVLRHAQRPAR